MFSKFFNPENSFFRGLAKFSDLLILSVLWVFASLLLIPLGAASSALYGAVWQSFKEDDLHAVGFFIKRFREDFRDGILPGLLHAGLLILFLAARNAVLPRLAGGSGPLLLTWYTLSFLWFFLISLTLWFFPVLRHFHLPFKTLVKNSLILGIQHLPRTLLLGALYFACIFCLNRTLAFIVPLFTLPGLFYYICALSLEPVLEKYEDVEGSKK